MISQEYENYYNDYDVQMLLADKYSNLKEWKKAEKHYKFSSKICSNRFLPLYRMMKIYNERGLLEKVIEDAKIVSKEIKIPSVTITMIQIEAKKK